MASVPSSALPGLERVPGKQNWIERLPAPMRAAWHRSIIYRAAKHMAAKGMPVGMAIASANNWAEHICHTGDVKQWRGPQTVKPSSVAECCAARTLWNTMRATARADTSIPAGERQAIELAFEQVKRDARIIELAFNPRAPKGRSTRGRLRVLLSQVLRNAVFGDHIDLAPTAAERDRAESKGQALEGGRFPIRNASDLDRAIRAVGRARPNTEEERRKVRRFIASRAKALGLSSRIPDNWRADGSLA